MAHQYDNCVIEALNEQHGADVISWWKSQGVDTLYRKGNSHKADGDIYRYYGLIDGVFDNWNYTQCKQKGAIIVPLPNPNQQIEKYLEPNNNLKTINTKTNETGTSINVQKVTPAIRTGKRIDGVAISGRRGKASTSIGYLSNQKISGY